MTDTQLTLRVTRYLGQTQASVDDINDAIDAELALQGVCCRVPDPSDVTPEAEAARTVLDQALRRRVAVNLARRGLPLGMQMSDVGTARISTNDPEVRRLEGPYRKAVVG